MVSAYGGSCKYTVHPFTHSLQYYDAPLKRYTDFPITDVLQVRRGVSII